MYQVGLTHTNDLWTVLVNRCYTTINKIVCYLYFKTIVNASFRCPRLNHATLDLFFFQNHLPGRSNTLECSLNSSGEQMLTTISFPIWKAAMSPYFWWRSIRYSCRLPAFAMSAKFPSLKKPRKNINRFQLQTGYIISRESCKNLKKNIHSYQICICANFF